MSAEALLKGAVDGDGTIVALTGAGISAESGIPTFRGPEGFWTVGAREYHPQEMATNAAFTQSPEIVWPWYLYRRSVCRAKKPNPGHFAMVDLERRLEDRFLLVTQNVDGLHTRAGNTLERTYTIHGNIDFMRCTRECCPPVPVPDALDPWDRDRQWDAETQSTLVCAQCGAMTRPHVLWFDEYYDEANFRFESSMRAAQEASLLLVVGTSGATNLPSQMVHAAAANGAAIIDVNPGDNVFGQLARRLPRGAIVREPSGTALPRLVAALG